MIWCQRAHGWLKSNMLIGFVHRQLGVVKLIVAHLHVAMMIFDRTSKLWEFHWTSATVRTSLLVCNWERHPTWRGLDLVKKASSKFHDSTSTSFGTVFIPPLIMNAAIMHTLITFSLFRRFRSCWLKKLLRFGIIVNLRWLLKIAHLSYYNKLVDKLDPLCAFN